MKKHLAIAVFIWLDDHERSCSERFPCHQASQTLAHRSGACEEKRQGGCGSGMGQWQGVSLPRKQILWQNQEW